MKAVTFKLQADNPRADLFALERRLDILGFKTVWDPAAKPIGGRRSPNADGSMRLRAYITEDTKSAADCLIIADLVKFFGFSIIDTTEEILK